MSTIFWLWVVSFAGVGILYIHGSRRARIAPVSYQFDWHPFFGVSNTVRGWGRVFQRKVSDAITQTFHHLFHTIFHRLKRFHDRIFGKKNLPDQTTPSFFLKTIAEHKEEASQDRKNGLS